MQSNMQAGTKGQRGVLQATVELEAERDSVMSDLPPELIRFILLGLWDGAKCIRSRGLEDLLSASRACKTWTSSLRNGRHFPYFSQTNLQICNELLEQSFWSPLKSIR